MITAWALSMWLEQLVLVAAVKLQVKVGILQVSIFPKFHLATFPASTKITLPMCHMETSGLLLPILVPIQSWSVLCCTDMVP